MATRATIRSTLLTFLATASDDPLYSATILDPIIQQAVDALLHDIQEANPDYLSTSVTLTANSTSSHLYTFATQAVPVTDFARWLEVRYTDENGVPLAECRLEELRDFGSDYFCITGPDETPILQTSTDSPAGTALFFRYAYWPVVLASDTSEPTGIPNRYHDVVELEALFAFGLGGEQRMPPELFGRWRDRRAQLLARVGRRGVQPSGSRLVMREDW